MGAFSSATVTTTLLFLTLLPHTAEQARIERGPYLQIGTPEGIVVRWNTNLPTDSIVWYGRTPDTLDTFVREPALTTEHEVLLTGLSPDTRYHYGVGSSAGLLAGGDGEHFFTTAPPVGTRKATRIWVIGDSGTADRNAAAVRSAYLDFTGERPTDVWLMLGDNAYSDGTDREYQAAVFAMYPSLLRTTVLWPTFGNHDANSASSLGQVGPYYDIFTLPKNGEAGGVPSGTEAYYSFDYANIHFVCLDSSESASLPAMGNWLTEDLAATTQEWIIAYWHHPPYSKGSHDSDTDGNLIEMRRRYNPILEDAGVDLVLGGHSHSYERSFLLDGHYGSSETLDASMILDAGNGRPGEEGSYKKPTEGLAGHEGTVYVVAGSSGKTSGGDFDHEAMYIALEELGSLVLDVAGNRLDATFLDDRGRIRDTFTILKGAGTLPAPTDLEATLVSERTIELSWKDNSEGEERFKIERSEDDNRWEVVAVVGADATNYTDREVEGGQSYFYRVRADSQTANSPYSPIVVVTTGATLPCGLFPQGGGTSLPLLLSLLPLFLWKRGRYA
ncbi:MAG: metallophosphoesterase [Deltaproteobacteria bacterium]|nr:MAG: metallophosphoesterase [Deltaproteobacteria bacterium]